MERLKSDKKEVVEPPKKPIGCHVMKTEKGVLFLCSIRLIKANKKRKRQTS